MPVRYSKGRRWRCRLAPCKRRVKRRMRRLLKPGWVQAGTVPKTTPMAPHVVCTAVGIREGDHVVQGVVAGNWLDPLRLKATTWQSGYPKPGASPLHMDTTQPVAYKHEPRVPSPGHSHSGGRTVHGHRAHSLGFICLLVSNASEGWRPPCGSAGSRYMSTTTASTRTDVGEA